MDIETLLSPENWHHSAGGPRYLQLRLHLARAIESGTLLPEQMLPSERDMAQLADVSRVTIRKAVEKLVEDGLIVQKRGSGSSVAPQMQRMEHSLSRLTSFTEDMQRRGKSSDSQLIECGLFIPSPEEIVALGLTAGEMVSRIVRLRRADGVAMAIESSSLAATTLPNPQDVRTSLYEVLEASDLRPVRAIQRISATSLDAPDARQLDVHTGAAALMIDRTSYLPSGRVVEFTKGLYRGDVYDFVAELRHAH